MPLSSDYLKLVFDDDSSSSVYLTVQNRNKPAVTNKVFIDSVYASFNEGQHIIALCIQKTIAVVTCERHSGGQLRTHK